MAVYQRARERGITLMLSISTTFTTFPQVLSVAETQQDIYCTIGVHPHHVAEEEAATPEKLLHFLNHPKVIGVGETGLDYYYEHSDRQLQQASFRAHIAAARIADVPVIVHTRDAEEDTITIIEDEYAKAPFKGLIHCFTASNHLAQRLLAIGFYISISGIITFKNAESLRQTVKALPLNRLLVETDAPYLAPMPHRGKRNEPAFVADTAQFLATLHNVSFAEISQQTSANFRQLFHKATL